MTRNSYVPTDRRVRRTRKLIQDALIELTIQKGFAAVTVHDITEYAEINRATFYRHYRDKFDLLDQHALEVYQLLDVVSSTTESSKAVDTGLVRILEHIQTHAKFYRVMLGNNGDPTFAGKIQHYIEKRMQDILPKDVHREKALEGMYLSYVAGASLGVIRWWLEHEMPYPPDKLASLFYRLIEVDSNAIMELTPPRRN